MKKIFLTILIIVVVVIVGAASYVKFALPKVDEASDVKIVATPGRIAHGEYLANHVTLCMDCHSTRDWSRFSGPMVPGTNGKGGELFDKNAGFPGTFYSKNITPANLKGWSDGQILRAFTEGVDKDGNALFPVMPYRYYGKMDKEDLYDIVAYIRTLAPIENKTPDHQLDFPMNFIINTIPSKSEYSTKPLRSDTIKYGSYLVNASACMECHTPAKRGQIIQEEAFSGGRAFQMPGGTVYSANITPDKSTGIGNWTVDQFVAKFKSYGDADNLPKMSPGEVNTVMPWSMFAGMDTSDLRSIYFYLQTLKPMHKKVIHYATNSEATASK